MHIYSIALAWSPRESDKQSTLQIILPKPVEILSISTNISLTESPLPEKKIENEPRTASNPILSSSNETPYSQSLTALLRSCKSSRIRISSSIVEFFLSFS